MIFLIYLTLISSLQAQENKILQFRSDPWCPFSCQETDVNKGIIFDIAQKILSEDSYSIVYKNINWARALKENHQGRINALVGCGKTDGNFIFPTVPQAKARFNFYVLRDSNWKYETQNSLKSKKIGIINGYTYDAEIQSLIDSKKYGFEVVSGDKPLVLLAKMLKSKRIDAFYEERSVLKFFINQNPEFKDFIKEVSGPKDATQDLYICLSPQQNISNTLAKKIDEGMKKLIKSGELKQIYEKYSIQYSD